MVRSVQNLSRWDSLGRGDCGPFDLWLAAARPLALPDHEHH